MAVLQAELNNSTGYFLRGTFVVVANEINSNGYLLNAVLNLLGGLSNASSNASSALLQFLSYSSASNGYNLPILLVLTPQLNSSIGQYQNYLSSFARFFGVNASQSLTHLHIKKENLASFGLSARADNTAESLLIALLFQIMRTESNSLISRVFVELFKQEFLTIRDRPIIRSILVIKLYSLATYLSNPNPLIANQIDTQISITPTNISN